MRLCVGQFILQVVVVLEELADSQGLVRQVDTELVAVGRQRLDMAHHGDSVHSTHPEFVVLSCEVVVFALKLGNGVFEASDAVQVGPDGLLDL